MSVLEEVAQAIEDRPCLGSPATQMSRVLNCTYPDCECDVLAAINAFLEAAAEQGWHMRPDEATEEMVGAVQSGGWQVQDYRAMLAAAPEFKWKDDS